MRRFIAYIDPNEEFCDEDKLSQVSVFRFIKTYLT